MFEPLQIGVELVERGLVPDLLTRAAIHRLCARRAHHARKEIELRRSEQFLQSLRSQPIAVHSEKANEQHYELPPEFFEHVLGGRRKYSCCYFNSDVATLDEAEDEALRRTVSHADLHDGQDILELGCGWGSLALWLAETFPASRIVAVSNSGAQRTFIEGQMGARALTNLKIVTSDINQFATSQTFDRIVSVEMFEHLRNFDRILHRTAGWLRPGGKMLVHHFCHRSVAYPFDVDGAANWMGRHFFTGGIMPTADLLTRFDRDMVVARQWTWNGRHYQKTADAWLARFDQNLPRILPILEQVYGRDLAKRWSQRWRVFFLAVSELFGFAGGSEWYIVHSLMEHQRARSASVRNVVAVEEH